MIGNGEKHRRPGRKVLLYGALAVIVCLTPTAIATQATATVSPGISAGTPASSPASAPIAAPVAPLATRAPQKFAVRAKPKVHGERRYLHTLKAGRGVIRPEPSSYSYRWFRNGHKIAGATKRTYRLTAADFGKSIQVKVVAHRRGYSDLAVRSGGTRDIGHRVAQKRVVRYRIVTRGRIVTSFATFKRQVRASLNDPRGWRINGTAFKPVSSGDSGMTIVLAEARTVPSYSSGCSVEWSCRVGRYVIINQQRWRFASPAWNRAGGSLRNYRHMVVGHETGHWLGWSHRGCPRRGAKAPVMQTQSKGLSGCRFNPWPTQAEWNTPRYRPADWATRVDVE